MNEKDRNDLLHTIKAAYKLLELKTDRHPNNEVDANVSYYLRSAIEELEKPVQ